MTEGRKDDAGKLDTQLLFRDLTQALREACGVMHWAAYVKENPYAIGSWVKVEPDRYRSALMRHLLAYYEDNNSKDEESGLSHLAHAAANVLILLQKAHLSGNHYE